MSTIEPQYLSALCILYARLKDCCLPWAITGSFGMALQGMDIQVHDIDIQTDQHGAYEIESKLSEYVVTPVRYAGSERVRSHLGKLEIEGIIVEIMGALQKRVDEHTWEEPVEVELYRRWVELEGMHIPVLSLEYEYQAYLKLGRFEKAERLRTWLQHQYNIVPIVTNNRHKAV
jgi:hypothetical protein